MILVKRVLEQGMPSCQAAEAAGVSARTVYKWVKRYREEGLSGLENRTSRPDGSPARTTQAVRDHVIALRRQRLGYRQIAAQTELSTSTIGRIAAAAGINRRSALEPAPEIKRYVRESPGELLHLDIKKLARFRVPGHRVTGARRKDSRGIGWEYVHVAIDDASRIGFSSILPDERSHSACTALIKALRYYRALGVHIQRILTDNGSCYRSKRFARLCRRLGIVHKRTRPYRPQTNGKAERFIQTGLREWAYARAYTSSESRAAHLVQWQHHYNWHRPHSAIQYQPPISILGLSVNNLVGLHS